MRADEIKKIAERQPFRPFGVRLTNGSEYVFRDPRELGAPKDFGMIFFFDESSAVRIDSDHIVEVFEGAAANGA